MKKILLGLGIISSLALGASENLTVETSATIPTGGIVITGFITGSNAKIDHGTISDFSANKTTPSETITIGTGTPTNVKGFAPGEIVTLTLTTDEELSTIGGATLSHALSAEVKRSEAASVEKTLNVTTTSETITIPSVTDGGSATGDTLKVVFKSTIQGADAEAAVGGTYTDSSTLSISIGTP